MTSVIAKATALAAANEIADQFRVGFFDDQMVVDVAVIIEKHINKGSTPTAPSTSTIEGWKEAAIAWSVCQSVHQTWAKGKDALYKTRNADYVRHADKAREEYNKLTKE